MNAKKTLLMVAVAAVLLCVCGEALAENGPAYGCYAWALPPSIYVNDYIPYYAAHPPVYYSYPVPRPYGFSPYAYPPGTMTPEPKLTIKSDCSTSKPAVACTPCIRYTAIS